jgi:hypothetical protein
MSEWTICDRCGSTVDFPLLRCVECLVATLPDPPTPAPPFAEPHWACPSCGTPCRCQPSSLARRLAHTDCHVYAA